MALMQAVVEDGLGRDDDFDDAVNASARREF